MKINTNYPVALDEAVKRIASFNCEDETRELLRNPRMAHDNVAEDDEDIYLLPKSKDGDIDVYMIEKQRLDETDWVMHLSGKGWCDTAMLTVFKKLRGEALKRIHNGDSDLKMLSKKYPVSIW